MPLHFELVTPERLYRSDDVYMVVVPGSEGDFGVLEGHAPMMSTLRSDATLDIYASAGAVPEKLSIAGGFAEVNENGLTVLAEQVVEAA
jgi:F-type H+-transporting ATPase subunit epsilon